MMSVTRTATVTRWQAAGWTIAALVILVFTAANAHLIYVATTSQPTCVPHARLGEADGGAFSAAQSACPGPGRSGSQPMEKRP
jgi:hypothetical protein